MIYLDIHGVLLDFHSSLNIPKDQYGTLSPELLKELKHDKSFWIDMPKFPWYHDLLDLVQSFDQVCLCTKPTNHNAGFMQHWIRYNLPSLEYSITTIKKPRAGILIDDHFSHEPDILFPQAYNFNADLVGYELSYVEHCLETIYA